jgi:P4 family phage/plasmid primase-like protien
MSNESRELRVKGTDELTAAEDNSDNSAVTSAKIKQAAIEAYRKHAKRTRARPAIMNMIELAKTQMIIELNDLDADPFALNTPAGIVDLRTGKIREHDLKQFCTKITRVSPDDTGADVWNQFLSTITCGDEELKNYIQEVAGMMLIGKVYAENLIIAYGSGGNGKSTFYNAQAAALGDYSHTINAEILTTSKQNNKASLAELKGKRFVIAPELEEGTRLSTSVLKQLASTDNISAEQKYKAPMSFTPSHHLVLYTNHMPKIGSTDSGTWRRLIVIPFKAEIPAAEDKKNYGAELVEKYGGAILQWMIDGAVKFCRNKFSIKIPQGVQAAINQYRESNDWFSTFLDENCNTGTELNIYGGDLYSDYRDWSMLTGEYVRSNKDFAAELEKRGFKKHKTKKGMIWYGLNTYEHPHAITPKL